MKHFAILPMRSLIRFLPVLPLALFPLRAQEATPVPPTDPAASLAAGQVAEEGDHEIDEARKRYLDVLREWNLLRPKAAEAQFRLAEIAEKHRTRPEARALYHRVTRDFQGAGDFAERAAKRLEALNGGNPSPGFVMSPELMKRYGLIPKGAPSSPDAQGSGHDVLVARYGLAATGTSASAPPHVERYGLKATPPDTHAEGLPTIDPNTGQPTVDAAGRPLVVDPNTGQLVNAEPAKPLQAAPPAPPSDELANLRAEAAQLAAQLRKARREARAAQASSPDQLPLALIQDPQMLRLVQEYDQARAQVGYAAIPGENEGSVARKKRIEVAEAALREYHQGTYRPRLEATVKLLAEELDELEVQIAKLRDAQTH